MWDIGILEGQVALLCVVLILDGGFTHRHNCLFHLPLCLKGRCQLLCQKLAEQ